MLELDELSQKFLQLLTDICADLLEHRGLILNETHLYMLMKLLILTYLATFDTVSWMSCGIKYSMGLFLFCLI